MADELANGIYNVDLSDDGAIVIPAMQYDKNSRKCIFYISNKGEVITLSSAVYTVRIKYKNGNIPAYHDLTINPDGSATFTITDDMTQIAGDGNAQLVLNDAVSDRCINSRQFIIKVGESVFPNDEIVTTEQFDAITNLILRADTAIATMENDPNVINKADVVNNLISFSTDKPLSANMGRELNTTLLNKASQSDLDVEKSRIDNLVATSGTAFYEKTVSGSTGALLVVESGATSGQINLASVTPVAIGYTATIGDYVRLVNGLSSGNAELVDIRVGADGVNYTTAGEAVRSLGKGKSIIDKAIGLNNLTQFLRNEFIERAYPIWTRSIESNYAISINNGYIEKVSNTGTAVVTVDVEKYDMIHLVLANAISNGSISWIMTNENNEALEHGSGNAVDLIVNVKEATKLLVCTLQTAANKAFAYPYIAEKQTIYNYNNVLSNKSMTETEMITGTCWQYQVQVADTNRMQYIYDVSEYDKIYVKSANIYKYNNIYTTFDSDDNIVSYKIMVDSLDNTVIDTSNCSKISIQVYVNSDKPVVYPYYKSYVPSPWKGKKIAWFGTSIPAGGLSGRNNIRSYPMIIGSMLGATVYNESFGESCVSCKYENLIDANTNPYGFSENYNRASRCLTNTIEEMNWVINNKDSAIFTTNKHPAVFADWEKYNIKDCSYESKVNRYLSDCQTGYWSPGDFIGDVDLYVFDHGHNDDMEYNSSNISYYDSKYGFRNSMNFLINHIKEHNPKARILIIGEYENQLRPLISQRQEELAKDWSIPIYRGWETLGWSQRTLKTTGYWNHNADGTYTWIKSGGVEQNIAYLDLWLADHVHPHSDSELKGMYLMANNITNWLNSIG